jgi:hypothetical protein
MLWRRLGGSAAVVGLCAVVGSASASAASSSANAASNSVTPAAKIAKLRDGSLAIAGRSLRCGSMRNVLDAGLPNLGLAAPGVVVFNPRELNRYSDTVRLFVYHHECGHHHVGGDELGADCWAATQGVRDGWLTRDGLPQVCRSFGNGPATDTHPAGARRCAALQRCFATAEAALAKERASSTIEAKAGPATTPDTEPKLVQGPTLKRSGMRPSLDGK